VKLAQKATGPESGFEHPGDTQSSLPGPKVLTGKWARVLSNHPFDITLERSEGIYLYDTEGNRYIDVSGGALATSIGAGDPRVLDAMREQAERFVYVTPAMANEPRADLCERIAHLTPGTLNTTYLISGGSEAVETALKLARQYHLATGNPRKSGVIGTWDSYHGMTLGALSVSGGPASRNAFDPQLNNSPHIRHYRHPNERPQGVTENEWGRQCALELEEMIHYLGKDNVAAFIATPVGAGKDYGLVPPRSYWATIREICDHYNVLLIADEVVTGFGRMGRWFGMEYFDVTPDIMVLGKGISSLYFPMGAVTVSDRINEPFAQGNYFIHGHTHMGNPIGCATTLAVLEVIEQDNLVVNADSVGAYLHGLLHNRFRAHPCIADIRGTGLLAILELVRDRGTMEYPEASEEPEQLFQAIAYKHGLSFYMSLFGPRRPSAMQRGVPLFIMPPLCINREQIDDLVERLDRTVAEWSLLFQKESS
jgi:adenosylmethionine-8-amino-7-oxononanoate aminotransferase